MSPAIPLHKKKVLASLASFKPDIPLPVEIDVDFSLSLANSSCYLVHLISKFNDWLN